ncbi:serine integrase [Mycobacterium phage DarthPhader]|uniref:Serine integrase n=1 Tax=Mycobacterium phage DarthPhader TaxID=1912975 RepID=A0A1I9S3Y2_9CAUD|nr:integrase [Mycobacterium phage DarthPhader]AOZ61276.1 serine integrase [Mycobacterium phage DarthPhader]
MRVLGRIRLSRATDESTSVERQREIIAQWASLHGHQIVGWAEDQDVSGTVDPFKAPALGPWFKEDKRGEWDILCCWKLDRLTRSAIRLSAVIGWCLDHDKTIVSCGEEYLDISTPVGRLIAGVIGFLAEGEREAISERTLASQKKLRETGRWGGGKIFYGYKAAERQDAAGWELVPDEHASKVLYGIIEKVLAGQSTESVARELNEAGEMAPLDYQRHRAGKPTKGGMWSNAHIRQQLRSKALLGHMTHNGKTVRDEDGLPILKGPPLIDQDKFDQLQGVLENRSFTVSQRSTNASPLLSVAFCGMTVEDGVCGKPLHIRQHRRNGKLYRYYQCTGGADGHVKTHTEANIIKADELEEKFENWFLAVYGDERVKEQVFIPASDQSAEKAELVRAAQDIAPLYAAAASGTMKSLYLSQLESFDRRIAELDKMPTESARYEWREQTKTYGEVWETSTTEERRQLLMKRKVRAEVAVPKGDGRYRSSGQAMIHMFALDIDMEAFEARAAEERRKYGIPDDEVAL